MVLYVFKLGFLRSSFYLSLGHVLSQKAHFLIVVDYLKEERCGHVTCASEIKLLFFTVDFVITNLGRPYNLMIHNL